MSNLVRFPKHSARAIYRVVYDLERPDLEAEFEAIAGRSSAEALAWQLEKLLGAEPNPNPTTNAARLAENIRAAVLEKQSREVG